MSIEDLLNKITLPELIKTQYNFPDNHLPDPAKEMIRQIKEMGLLKNIKPGSKIGITAGSRGVANLPELIRELVTLVRLKKADPFVFPAMGSHGGATAEGQYELLKNLGITEDYVGCPIISSMDTVLIGKTAAGIPAYMDRSAYESNGVITINRIKPHTSFRGKHESGLVKMLVIGMGKQRGAEICHQLGFPSMADNIENLGRVIMSSGKVLLGVGLVENTHHKTCAVGVASPDQYFAKDSELLEEAWKHFPRLPFDDIDVLVIDEIGKEISGTGFDTNVVGRFRGSTPRVTRIVVLNLSEKTGGNANGIGRADITTQKVFDRFSAEETYPNAITSTAMESVKIPLVLKSDELAIKAAIKTSLIADYPKVRLVRIKNTLLFNEMMISRSLAERPNHKLELKITGDKYEKMDFDKQGNLQ